MNRLKITSAEPPEGLEFVGGGGITARIINEEVPSAIDPVSETVKLIYTLAPQIQPELVEEFSAALAETVEYENTPSHSIEQSGTLHGETDSRSITKHNDMVMIRHLMMEYQAVYPEQPDKLYRPYSL